jgi:hypothetical protein
LGDAVGAGTVAVDGGVWTGGFCGGAWAPAVATCASTRLARASNARGFIMMSPD